MSQSCYVCARHPIQSKTLESDAPGILHVNCPRCGVYDIAHKFIAGETNGTFWTEELRLTISHAIRRATDAHGRFGEAVLDYQSVKRLRQQHPLPDPVESADIFIDGIARRSQYGRFTPPANAEVWAARIGLKGPKQIKTMHQELEPLVKQSGLGVPGAPAPGSETIVRFGLTLEGYRRYREIRRERGPGTQAFVAMWFHPRLLAAYTEGFAPALTDTGHQPYRVDFAAHNNKIDDELVAEIRRSKLAIVDTTGARPNAYWEAGFAAGLGTPVIWCCNDTWQAWSCTNEPDSATAPVPTSSKWTDNLPFDIRQHAFTFWSNPDDLRKKLTARIRALGFDAAWNRGQRAP